MICVHASEWRKTIPNDCKQSDKYIVDHVDEVFVSITTTYPPNEKENPNQTKSSDEKGVKRDEKAKS